MVSINIGNGIQLVNQATGYGTVIGMSVLFTIIILVAVKVQKMYLMEDSGKSEMFMVANRSVGTGLTASAVFSSWMWVDETVFACTVCYQYGVSGPMWYGSGLCFQIAFMAVIGVLAKIRTPYAHTSLEITRKRYGNLAHIVYICLNLINTIIGCGGMILTASQLIVGISGMHLAAATVLIPAGVVGYTAVGGLKATFITDFIHTAVAMIIIIWLTLSVLTNEHIGGLHGLYDKIKAIEAVESADKYITGNYLGSLLTFKSKGGIMFSIVLKIGNLALVTMDTAFWQKTFAAEVHSTVKGYNLAALSIFAVPWGLGTIIGLSGRVIETLPIFPTYPNPYPISDVYAGLTMPYTVYALVGPGAAVGMLLLIFMAVTSTLSSSMIGVSSIISFDIYRSYINPSATDKQIVRISHLGVVFHGIFITGFALMLNYAGANMNWMAYMSPVVTCAGVFPLLFTITWRRQSTKAAILAPILGLVTGTSIWIGSAYGIYGAVTIATTMEQAPSVYGSLGSLLSPLVYSPLISYLSPELFDWREFLTIDLVEDVKKSGSSTPSSGEKTGQSSPVIVALDQKTGQSSTAIDGLNEKRLQSSGVRIINGVRNLDNVEHPFDAQTLKYLSRWLKTAWVSLGTIIALTWVVWPLPLYRDYIFTKSFFSGWCAVAVIWQWFAFVSVVLYPVFDGRHEIAKSLRGVWRTYNEKRGKA